MAALAVTVSAIALTGAACGGSDDGDEAETPDVTVETDGMITSDLGGIVVNSPASITVTAQSGDGTTVTIDQVDLPAPGFVLVLDPTPEVLGSSGRSSARRTCCPSASRAMSRCPSIRRSPHRERCSPSRTSTRIRTVRSTGTPPTVPVIDLSTLPESGSTVKTFAEFDYTVG